MEKYLVTCTCGLCSETLVCDFGKAVELLDGKYQSTFSRPWYEIINLETLDQSSGKNCALGQLFGGFFRVPDELFKTFCGSSLPGVKDEWIRIIQEKRSHHA
jgi:hypothetical protein